MILDATAGNRRMWFHTNFKSPFVIFMDREFRLKRPPDLFADFRFCPFREDVFECILFDPPYYWRNDENWIFFDPEMIKNKGRGSAHFGLYKSRIDLIRNISMGLKEFMRLTKRLCFKWGESYISLWQILSLFRGWKEIHRKEVHGSGFKYLYKRRSRRFWVTFILKTS